MYCLLVTYTSCITFIYVTFLLLQPPPPKKTKLSHNNIYLKFKEVLEEKKITIMHTGKCFLFAGFQPCRRIFKAQNVCFKLIEMQAEIYSNA